MNRLSVIGADPPVATAVASKVTNASRELDASARLGTELMVSWSIRITKVQPSRVTFVYVWGAIATGSACAGAVAKVQIAVTSAMTAPTRLRTAMWMPRFPLWI
ncbi:hypothetical protein E3G47_002322 [Mycobacteroides abscessus]|nr:hypothetical protein [Mycobacteroides abscessus]SKT09912.1 Uncharacterised protein [Mycobacteroides abscessus subsp. abscessus]SLC94716.1 Uncharacterised protein [Mycobacteroides abscessus subsp. massiliense]